MSNHLTRAARDQIGADILLQLYGRITGDSLDGIRYPSQLSGSIITREQIDGTEYDSLADMILELRNAYSASGMRCLRSNAATRKTPVLNLIRQVARANGLALVSNRKPSGYTPDGRKQFHYWYTFEPLDGDFEATLDSLSQQPESAPILPEPDTTTHTLEPKETTNDRDVIPDTDDMKSAPNTKIPEENIIVGTIILPDTH
jgi:hypothetical protein